MICVYPWLQEIGQTQHDLLKLTKCSSTAKKLDHIGYEKNKSTKFSAQRHSPTCRAGKRRSANRFNKGSPQKGLGFCLIRHRACYGRDIFANGFCHPLRWFLPMSLQVLQNQPTPSWDAKKKGPNWVPRNHLYQGANGQLGQGPGSRRTLHSHLDAVLSAPLCDISTSPGWSALKAGKHTRSVGNQ